jgi:hypothetical protein
MIPLRGIPYDAAYWLTSKDPSFNTPPKSLSVGAVVFKLLTRAGRSPYGVDWSGRGLGERRCWASRKNLEGD